MVEILIVIASGEKEGLPATGNKRRFKVVENYRILTWVMATTHVCIVKTHQVTHLRTVRDSRLNYSLSIVSIKKIKKSTI